MEFKVRSAIQEILKKKEWTQEKLAEFLECSDRNIRHYLNYRNLPDMDKLHKIAGLVGQPIGWFVGDAPPHVLAQLEPALAGTTSAARSSPAW